MDILGRGGRLLPLLLACDSLPAVNAAFDLRIRFHSSKHGATEFHNWYVDEVEDFSSVYLRFQKLSVVGW